MSLQSSTQLINCKGEKSHNPCFSRNVFAIDKPEPVIDVATFVTILVLVEMSLQLKHQYQMRKSE